MILPHTPVSPLELVAPARSWTALYDVISSGADAIYLDGQAISTRSSTPNGTFDESDLPEIVKVSHQNGRRVYVYVSPTAGASEALADFLVFLSGLRVDAVEFEDLSVPQVVNERELCLCLHARWAPAFPNDELLPFLETMRVTRFRPGARLPLSYYWKLHHLTGLSLELPVHSPLLREHSLLDLSEAGIVGLRVESPGECPARAVKACRQMINRALEEQWLAHPDLLDPAVAPARVETTRTAPPVQTLPA